MGNHAAVSIEPAKSARSAGLRYVHDDGPGIHRQRRGKGFVYRYPNGRLVRDKDTLARIDSLAIPPAWSNVWICPIPHGHLQATGLDDRSRKQYRYHTRWRAVRDETKYHRLIAFARALPRIRTRLESDLAETGLTRNKVLAAVIRLLETTHIRVGNEEYARANHSYGLTTLRNHHVEVNGGTIHFHFRGKSGVRHRIDLHDARLARIIHRCQDLPGQELFHYLDEDGEPHAIDSADVNDYLREIAGEEFTAKDFRTWAGTVLAAWALKECDPFESETEARHNVVSAVAETARHLGNTPAVCRKCYVHPTIVAAYLDGSLGKSLRRHRSAPAESLTAEEAAVLSFLQTQEAE
jgi:DNA topoisomerase-1